MKNYHGTFIRRTIKLSHGLDLTRQVEKEELRISARMPSFTDRAGFQVRATANMSNCLSETSRSVD